MQMINELERSRPALLWDTLKALMRGSTIKYLAYLRKERNKDIQLAEDALTDQKLFLDGLTEMNEELIQAMKDLAQSKAVLTEKYKILGLNRKKKNIDRSLVYNNICSTYFFQKVKGIPGAIRTLINENNVELKTDEEILDHTKTFYDNLYSTINEPSFRISNFTDICSNNQLDEDQVKTMNEEITKDELFNAMKKMKKTSAPGFDGFTVPFYICFWNLIGNFVYKSIIYAYESGSFTPDQ